VTESASFRVDFETQDARANVDSLADATESAFNRMEAEAEQSLSASGQEMDRLAEIFRSSSTIIEAAIQALIVKEEELARTTKETADAGTTLSDVFRTVGTGLAAAGTAIAGAAAALGVLVQTTTAAIVETDNYAQAVGISTEAMQAFEFAAVRAGGETDALREGLRTSQEAVAEFVNAGTGPAAEALQLLGVQLTDAGGKVRSMEQLFPELVAALGSVQDPAERTRLAIQLFGEEDSRVLVTLSQNPQAFDQARAAMERYGTVAGGELVQQSRQFQTGMTDLMAAVQGLAQELVAALLPTINQLLPQLTEWIASVRTSDAVQKELIPTIQEVVGWLGQIGTAVGVLHDVWAALNVAFNAVVMAILEGVGTIAQGLGTIITAAGQAADFLGMDGVAAQLQSAGAAVTAVGVEADRMGDIARETMQEWQQSLNATTDTLGTTQTATEGVTSATTALGETATATGTQVAAAQAAMTEETMKHRQALMETNKAYTDLGVKSGESLRKLADEAVKDFETIRQAGTETPERLAQIWTEEVVPKIVDAYQSMPEKFDEVDKQILAGAQQTTTDITRAYEKLGLDAPEALRKMAADTLDAFTTIVDSGTRSWEDLRRIYVEQVVPAIEAATGKIAPSFETAMGIVQQSATTAGEKVTQVFHASGETIEGTMSSLSKLLLDLGIQTEQGLRSAAAEAESQLLTVVSLFGVRSKEAAQAWDATIDDISGGYDRLPPHVERIGRLIAEANQRSADDSARAHRDGVERIVLSYEQGFTRINGIIQATTGTIENGGFRWGTTLEELQAQLAQTREEYNQWSRAVGVGGDVVQFQMARLNEIINELQRRIAALRDQEEETTTTTQRFTEAVGQTGQAARTTASAVDTLTAANARFLGSQAEFEAMLERFLAHGPRLSSARRQATSTGSGHGVLVGSDGGDSLTIGLPPASLPPGVPLPSDLGLPDGGVLYDPYSTQGVRSAARQPGPPPTTTTTTIVNVQEPITLQTRADSSALTGQEVVNALNEAIRRGVLRPELSQALR
jgi:TP901 family phage tail tape measure protein